MLTLRKLFNRVCHKQSSWTIHLSWQYSYSTCPEGSKAIQTLRHTDRRQRVQRFLLKIPPTPRSVKYSCGMPLHLSAGWALKSGVSTQAPFAFRDGSPSTSVRAGSSERCPTRSHRLGHKACWLQESSESHFRLLLTGLQNAWLLGFSHLSVSRMIQAGNAPRLSGHGWLSLVLC